MLHERIPKGKRTRLSRAIHDSWRTYSFNSDYVAFKDQKTGLKRKVNDRTHKFTVSSTFDNDLGGPRTLTKTYQVSLRDEVTYGPNVPGWRDKLRQGIGVVTTLSGIRQTLKVDFGGQYGNVFPPRPKTVYGVSGGPIGIIAFSMPQANTVTSNTADVQARKKLLQSYISETQSFSGGKFLAELKDSIELVVHPVRSIYKKTYEYAGVVKRLGKVYQHRPKTAAALLSESWLAFSFGVKPFVQDANDASQALNRLISSPRHDLRYVRGVGHDRSFSQSKSQQILDGSTTAQILVSTSTDFSVRIEGAFRQKPVGTSNLLDEFGLNLSDIAPAVWEGIPWSFFVDYFTNVGECLDAWRMINVDQAWLIRTVRNRTTTTCSPTTPNQTPPTDRQNFNRGGGTVIATSTFTSRSPTSFFSETPSFHFNLPGKSLSRMLNITSLIGVINDSHWGSRPTLTNTLTDRPKRVIYKGALPSSTST